MSDAASDDAAKRAAYEAFMAEEFAKTAAEQERRKAASAGKVVSLKTGISGKSRAAGLLEASEKARVGYLAKQANGVAIAKPQPGSKPDLALPKTSFNSRGTPLEKTIGAVIQIGTESGISFSYDLFRDQFRVGDHALQQRIGESIENAILVLRTAVIKRFDFEPKADTIKAAVYRVCLSHSFNPVRDYLDGLKWDGTARLDSWLSTYLSAADDPLNRAIGRKALVAAVRRVRQPGAKFDQVLVLEGLQGSGKSSAIKILAGDFFSDAEIIGKHGREVQELCGGVWLYEISELAGLSKSDVEHVKGFASRTHDKARPAYGYASVERGRTCVFIGTCNRDDYLIDDTGNRRFWPVATGKIDLTALSRDRDQLWAEAARAEAEGEALIIEPELWGTAAERADARLATDPWQDILSVAELLPSAAGSVVRADREIRVASEFLLSGVLGFARAQVRSTDAKRLAMVMKRLGWTGPKVMRIGEKAVRAYAKSLGQNR